MKLSSEINSSVNMPVKNYNDLKSDNLDKMKELLNLISSDDIINDILKSSNVNTRFEKKDLTLQNMKSTALSNFIENIRTKSQKEIKLEFENRLNEYNTSTINYCERKNKENIEFISQVNSYKTKNSDLESTITNLDNENKNLKQQLKQNEEMIFKLQTKFEIFLKLRPIIEEFFKEFPNENPVKIISEIKERKEHYFRLLEDINNLKQNMLESEKEKKEIKERDRLTIESLCEKLLNVEQSFKDKIDKYLNQISSLEIEITTYKSYKTDNIKLTNMLFHLYNRLIEHLSLDKNITIDPELKVIEKDFKPDLFDNNEIAQYIKTMLINSNKDNSAKMLRETIAYANMMLRIYLKEKINKRFDPVAIFKDLKELLETSKKEKLELKKQNDELKNKIKLLEQTCKKLDIDIKHRQIDFDNLKKKTTDKKSKINIRARNAFNTSNDIERMKTNDSPPHIRHSMKKMFITDNKYSTSVNPSLSAKNRELNVKSASTRAATARRLYIRPKKKAKFFKDNFNLFDDNSNENEDPDDTRNLSNIYLDSKQFKKIEISKNKDKLERQSIQITAINSDGLQALVNHTNKLFFYKSKMKYNSDKDKNIFNKFRRNLDNNFNKLEMIKHTDEAREYGIGNKVLNNLDGIIYKLKQK